MSNPSASVTKKSPIERNLSMSHKKKRALPSFFMTHSY